jgi:hypothetical protein
MSKLPPTSKQLRVRTSEAVATRLLALPPRARSRAVSLMVAAAMEQVDLAALLDLRGELVRLGNLLNQSLRTSWGAAADRDALQAIVTKLGRVLK